MVNFTLIEFHLDDAKLTAQPLGSGGPSIDLGGGEGGTGSDAGSEGGQGSEESSGGGSKLPMVVGLLVLVAVAAVARRKMSSGESAPELEDVTA